MVNQNQFYTGQMQSPVQGQWGNTGNYSTMGNYSAAPNPSQSLIPPAMQPSELLIPSPGGTLGEGGGGNDWLSMDSIFGKTNKDGSRTTGWGLPAVQTFSGLAQAYLGMQQYNLAKDSFKESKRQFGLNYEAQAKLTNAQLEDRQRARVSSGGSGYVSVSDYMAKNGVKTDG